MSWQVRAGSREFEPTRELWRALVEFVPAAVAVLDRALTYVEVSDRWKAAYGLQTLDIIGHGHYEILPEVPARWKKVHRRALAGIPEHCSADPFVRADGSVQWVRWAVQPWRLRSGDIGGIAIFSEVLADRRRTAETADTELVSLSFADLLRRLLDQRGLTQAALAGLLGVNRVAIARMAIGQRRATAEMCERIANALKLTDAERYALDLAAARAKGFNI